MFQELKDRGLSGVSYVVSDNHTGLRNAIARNFQGSVWQRCQVHFIRNVLAHGKRQDRNRIVAQLREITGSSCRESAHRRLRESVERFESSNPKISDLLDTHGMETLSVYALPEQHRIRMRSTNMLERFNQEIKRRTRVVRIFPNEQACIRLVSALAMEMNEVWMERKYLDMECEANLHCSQAGRGLIPPPAALPEPVLSL